PTLVFLPLLPFPLQRTSSKIKAILKSKHYPFWLTCPGLYRKKEPGHIIKQDFPRGTRVKVAPTHPLFSRLNPSPRDSKAFAGCCWRFPPLEFQAWARKRRLEVGSGCPRRVCQDHRRASPCGVFQVKARGLGKVREPKDLSRRIEMVG
ncbi:hypothetical protein JRQ81_000842, partial [Phrynocephalus forsythii]